MINIVEIAKENTREEFIKEASSEKMGKFNTNYECPNNYGLEEIEKCKPYFGCKECWTNAVKDIKFKDDIEDNVDNVESDSMSMNKGLNIIEAMEMPIETEFEVWREHCEGKVIIKKSDYTSVGEKYLYWSNGKDKVIIGDYILSAKFKVIEKQQKPVNFMEVVNSDKKCKVEHELIDELKDYDKSIDYSKFYDFDFLISYLSNDFYGDKLRLIIKEGRWYLGEDNND